MAVHAMLLVVVVAQVTASASTLLPPAHESIPSSPPANHSELFNLLQEMGFSDTCVAASLDTCAATPQDRQLATLTEEVRHLLQGVAQAVNTPQKQPRHCKDFLDAGDGWSGVRVIYPYPGEPDRRLAVYCDQITDAGGWTVFQRRTNSTVREDFYRTWLEYKVGFGNIEGEFWLGLNPLHALTSTGQQELRVDLADWEGGHRYAKYDSFSVGDPATKYRLQVGRYSGTAGDGLAYHQGMKFSTHDADNDASSGSCAQNYRGAWWYSVCHHSNLNGYQYEGAHTDNAKGINWGAWRGNHYSVRHTAMMVRPAH